MGVMFRALPASMTLPKGNKCPPYPASISSRKMDPPQRPDPAKAIMWDFNCWSYSRINVFILKKHLFCINLTLHLKGQLATMESSVPKSPSSHWLDEGNVTPPHPEELHVECSRVGCSRVGMQWDPGCILQVTETILHPEGMSGWVLPASVG